MELPEARGALSSDLISALRDKDVTLTPPEPDDDEDLHLTLWTLYELHYRGFDEVDDAREWDPDLLALRARLEAQFEAELRAACSSIVDLAADQESVPDQLVAITAYDTDVSLPQFLQRDATADQYLEFLMQRSLYHLKESDPQSWAIPRLDGAAKVALAELQYDEFGAGRPERLHSHMYAVALDEAGLDPEFGAYIERVPATTLAVNNLMSLLGLSHRLRGAALGHLAAFESTSSVPCRRIAAGIERVGLPEATAAYFHEHVEADAAHEQIVLRDICRNFVESEPTQRAEVLFGVAACLYLDALAAEDLLDSWAPSVTGELAS
jgi:hypothetical protein